jgi:tetratricopeptide (TPR) repeat protein
MGVSPEVDPLVLTGTIMNEDEEWRKVREHTNPTMEICLLWCQASLAFHLHKFIKARQLLEQCQTLYRRVPHVMLGSFQILLEFWNGMTAVRLLWKYRRDDSLSVADKKYQTELESSAKMSLDTLTTLAKYASDNVNSKVLLLQGEMEALQGKHDESMELFQRALESAEDGLLDKALIGEQVGLTLRLCGKDDSALDYLEDCCASYRAWGALIKVNHVKGTVIPEAIYEWEE